MLDVGLEGFGIRGPLYVAIVARSPIAPPSVMEAIKVVFLPRLRGTRP